MTRGSAKRAREVQRALGLQKCCPICLDEVTNAMTTPCGHRFCRGCIIQALNLKRECPVCRCRVPTHRSLRDEESCPAKYQAKANVVDEDLEPCRSKAPRLTLQKRAMTKKEAQRLAVEEGLTLLTSHKSATGFKHAFKMGKTFTAEIVDGKAKKRLGYFNSAPEAALAVARHFGPERCAEEAAYIAKQITDEEAHRLARQEGLELLTSDNATGFFGVTYSVVGYTFMAKNKYQYLGNFRSAAGGALAIARHLGPERCAAMAAAAARPPMTVAEAQRLAAAEGLSLVTANNVTGYKGVNKRGGSFRVKREDNKYGGSFRSIAEAALARARSSGPQ